MTQDNIMKRSDKEIDLLLFIESQEGYVRFIKENYPDDVTGLEAAEADVQESVNLLDEYYLNLSEV